MKEGVCKKCGNVFLLEKHHILPKAEFGENPYIIEICANCHRDYHYKLGKENLRNPDKNFHFQFYRIWLLGLISITFLCLFLVFC